MPQYPSGLPLGLKSGRSYQVVSPLQRTQLDSGRARQRRKFTSVPVLAEVTWLFKSIESFTFQSWFRDALTDGALWFECPLRTDMGLINADCRFTDIYRGPVFAGPDLWTISATLEIRERPLLAPPWGEFPEYLLGGNIIDLALNHEWPEA